MAPFNTPTPIITGIKERPESLLVQGERLYIGTAAGNLHVYDLAAALSRTGDSVGAATLVETKKGLSRRAIDQLGYIKDINSLVVLSETLPTLYPLPSYSPPTPLTKAKGALSFAIHSSVHNAPLPDAGESDANKGFDAEGGAKAPIPIPVMVTSLVVGCRRKVVVYTWRDGEAMEAKETPLPHSPRSIAFLSPDTVILAYSPTEYATFTLSTATIADVVTPASIPASSSAAASTSLGGLGGYMGLGGKAAKPGIVGLGEGEGVIVKDTFVNPYIFSILPPGTVPVPAEDEGASTADAGSSSAPLTASQSSPQPLVHVPGQVHNPALIQAPVIQIISSISALPVQTLPFPFTSPTAPSPTPPTTLRLLAAAAPSPTAHAAAPSPVPLFLVSTPLDRTQATAEGSTLWLFAPRPWSAQIDELVEGGRYADALALLEKVGGGDPNKTSKKTLITSLHAVSLFRDGKFDAAIDMFLELEINPAKVVALYPGRVSGRLAVGREEWVRLFGGPGRDAIPTKSGEVGAGAGSIEKLAASLSRSPSPAGSVRARTKTSFGALLPGAAAKDDDAVSLRGGKKAKVVDDSTRALETLWRYLTSLRPKLAGALSTHFSLTPSSSHLFPPLSSTSPSSLYALPSGVPLGELGQDEMVKMAQIVDTVLFKSYLIGRPVMLGPLCRVANWCEVSEVEEELRAREKFAELIFLYNGKKMHAKALRLLQQLSEKEDDMRDKLGPSISYLQKLGPEYLDQIFESARWVFEQDRDMAFQIFTSDDVDLPRSRVTDYLEKIDLSIAARYLEYLIEEKEEESVGFHDRLAELYLRIAVGAKRRGDEDLYEARAILLGRMGRHEHALELYVYKLGDFAKAEEHCKRVSAPSPTTPSPIFLSLLKLYLRPTIPNPPNLLSPALSLIARHRARLDPIETLQLLPPLVSAQDVRPFLQQALRAPVFDSCVVKEITHARSEGVARKLMVLESRRVKVTDSRICPQCHKRLGNSVIAVHAPRGEVTHYQCREAFSKKLNAVRQS
ncbi:hypothetical protein HYDPIDRAFT_174307 [Hydnomerulius pinastri MD-312]|nr:hypothetical protein HYDPIDRAFT_174307 [Hydnomerulius pinastri MD-312]